MIERIIQLRRELQDSRDLAAKALECKLDVDPKPLFKRRRQAIREAECMGYSEHSLFMTEETFEVLKNTPVIRL